MRWYQLSGYGRVRSLATRSVLPSVPEKVQPPDYALALPWVHLLVLQMGSHLGIRTAQVLAPLMGFSLGPVLVLPRGLGSEPASP